MKKAFLVIVVLAAALLPALCGRLLLGAQLDRLGAACGEAGINDRPWTVEKGYLSSSVYLQEPLATTLSGGGLKRTEAEFLRGFEVTYESDLSHGPYCGLLGREESRLSLDGKEWRLQAVERRETSLLGAWRRRTEFRNVTAEEEGLLLSLSNCWTEGSREGFLGHGPGSFAGECGALVLWPCLALKDASWQGSGSEAGEARWEARCGELRLGERQTLKGLALRSERTSGGRGRCSERTVLTAESWKCGETVLSNLVCEIGLADWEAAGLAGLVGNLAPLGMGGGFGTEVERYFRGTPGVGVKLSGGLAGSLDLKLVLPEEGVESLAGLLGCLEGSLELAGAERLPWAAELLKKAGAKAGEAGALKAEIRGGEITVNGRKL